MDATRGDPRRGDCADVCRYLQPSTTRSTTSDPTRSDSWHRRGHLLAEVERTVVAHGALWELGERDRIPARAVRAMVDGLERAAAAHVSDPRRGLAPRRSIRAAHASCHCALGTIDQVLAACGVDVDAELPWIAPWFERYQMSDGGLNCDETAYLVDDECPSSMVGTVPRRSRRCCGADRASFSSAPRRVPRSSASSGSARARNTTPTSATPRRAGSTRRFRGSTSTTCCAA